jgi:calcium-dependent protein kinase
MLSKNNALNTERGSIYYLAPEILKKNYDHKVDIWSAGVIFYILLTGQPPFNATIKGPNGNMGIDSDKIKKLILKGDVCFKNKAFEKYDPEVKEIVQLMLETNPVQRPEAKEILQLPWFRENKGTQNRQPEGNGNIVLSEVLQNLSNFNRGSSLKKGIAMYFANYFDLKKEKETLYKYFQSIDKDRDGQLSFAELVDSYSFKVGVVLANP